MSLSSRGTKVKSNKEEKFTINYSLTNHVNKVNVESVHQLLKKKFKISVDEFSKPQ